MPKKNQSKTTSPGARVRVRPGNNTSQPRRTQIRGNRPGGPAVIANSIFALTLPPIKGCDLFGDSNPFGPEVTAFDAPVSEIVSILHQCLNRAILILDRGAPVVIPAGSSTADQFKLITSELEKRILPPGFSWNIDHGEGNDYYFTLYKLVDFENFWHFFAIDKVVRHLEKKDAHLLDLFIGTLNLLGRMCGFSFWFDGNLYAYDMLIHDEPTFIDHVENHLDWSMDDQDEEAVEAKRQKLFDCRTSYLKGEVFRYQKRMQAKCDPKKLQAAIDRYSRKSKIAAWIQQALDFTKAGIMVGDFDYDEHNDENEYPIRLSDMVTVVWSEEDFVFDTTCEYMDNDAANFGTEEPYILFRLTPTTKKIDFDRITKMEKWLKDLTLLFRAYQDITAKLPSA